MSDVWALCVCVWLDATVCDADDAKMALIGLIVGKSIA
jgi:hypothetical protein